MGARLLFGFVLLGCACGAEAPSEEVGRARSAVYGGAPDLDDAPANVVVRYGDFPGCTGILITPRVVLTASHCVLGSRDPAAGPVCSGQSPNVELGCAGVAPSLRVLVATGMVGDCQSSDRVGDDVGLLFLEKAVVRSEAPSASVTIPVITRPSFRSDGGQGIGVAGYSPLGADGAWLDGIGLRHAILLGAFDGLRHADCMPGFTCPRGAYWTLTTNLPFQRARTGLRAGDSGAPLYVLRGATRDPIGIASAVTGDPLDERAWFTDVTSPRVRDWILSHVREATSPLRHSRAWLARHGKTGDDWFGEADYTGDCRPEHDPDCDGWNDEHDDCPTIPDSDQLDGDDDGLGDVCDPCPAGGGGPSCAGPVILRSEIRTSVGSGSPSGG